MEQQQMKQGEQIDYKKSRYRNPFWAVFFILQFVAVLGCFVYFGIVKHGIKETTKDLFSGQADSLFYKYLGIVIGMTILSGILGWVYLQLCKRYPRGIIKVSLFSVVGLMCVHIGVGCAFQIWAMAAVWGVLLLFFLLYLWFIWKKIPFAAACLNMSVQCLDQHSGPIFCSLFSAFLQICVSTIYILLIMSLVHNDALPEEGGASYAAMVCFTFSFIWSSTVVKYIAHVTTAGVAATWYFNPSVEHGATRGAFSRAWTTSFGSICFGAAIVALIETLRQMAESAKNDRNSSTALVIIACCFEMFLACLGEIVEYINSYAFCFVAIYGDDFCTAAKNTMSLLKGKGFTMVINDDLIDTVLWFGVLFISLLTGAAGFGISYLAGKSELPADSQLLVPVAIGFAAFLLSYFVVKIILSVISSIVKSFFVCFASDPTVLASTHPDVYNNVTTTLGNKYGSQLAPQYVNASAGMQTNYV